MIAYYKVSTVFLNFIIILNLLQPKHRVPGFTLIKWGFCIPRECTGKDLENAIFEKLQIPSRIRPAMCQKAEKEQYISTYGDIFTRYFFFSIATAIGLSTFLYSKNKLEKTGNDTFTVYKNVRLVLKVLN